MGYTTVLTIADLAEGKKVDEKIIIPASWITSEDVD
jgi:hypothetical protein